MLTAEEPVSGYIHSFESFATVDGPGIRFIVFLQGCPLRCLYCHNVDCRHPSDGKQMTADEVVNQILKHKNFIQNGGGVTFSGGEPLLQPKFLSAMLKSCKEAGLHTTIDTSGFCSPSVYDQVLPHTDLVLLDIKHFDPVCYRQLTGVDLKPTLEFAVELFNRNIPFWLRYVLVPGVTDQLPAIENLAKFLKDFSNLERVEILPFHKMGEQKWDEKSYYYTLKDVHAPSAELIEKVAQIFIQEGLNVIV